MSNDNPTNDDERVRIAVSRAANAAQSTLPLAGFVLRSSEANLTDLRQLVATLEVLVAALAELRDLHRKEY
jgi:hypothetical protein